MSYSFSANQLVSIIVLKSGVKSSSTTCLTVFKIESSSTFYWKQFEPFLLHMKIILLDLRKILRLHHRQQIARWEGDLCGVRSRKLLWTGKAAYRWTGFFPRMDLHLARLLSNVWIICIPEGSSDLPPCCAEYGCFIGNGNDADDRFWPWSWFHTQPWKCHSPWMIQPLEQEWLMHFAACVCTCSCIHIIILCTVIW